MDRIGTLANRTFVTLALGLWLGACGARVGPRPSPGPDRSHQLDSAAQSPRRHAGDKARAQAARQRLARLYRARRFFEAKSHAEQQMRVLLARTESAFLVGELGIELKDYHLAHKGYAAAIEHIERRQRPTRLLVHGRPIVNPLRVRPDKGLVWACYDGLGASLVMLKRYREAVPYLTKALTAARAHRPSGRAIAHYNLACSFAQLEKYPLALDHLKKSMELNSKYRSMWRQDADFAKVRQRPEFKALLDN